MMNRSMKAVQTDRIFDYVIFYSYEPESLMTKVSEYIKKVWQPFGSMVVENTGKYLQPMVLYEMQSREV